MIWGSDARSHSRGEVKHRKLETSLSRADRIAPRLRDFDHFRSHWWRPMSFNMFLSHFIFSMFFQFQIYLSNLFHSLHRHTSEIQDDIGWSNFNCLHKVCHSSNPRSRWACSSCHLRQADQRINGANLRWFVRFHFDVSNRCFSLLSLSELAFQGGQAWLWRGRP